MKFYPRMNTKISQQENNGFQSCFILKGVETTQGMKAMLKASAIYEKIAPRFP